jgi:hypothetical protein
MSLLNKLGFGLQPSDDAEESTDETSTPDEDITTSHQVIHDSSDDKNWDEFENVIERLTAKELNDLNARLDAGVEDFSPWREYADAFMSYEWYIFCRAYKWATGRDFSFS